MILSRPLPWHGLCCLVAACLLLPNNNLLLETQAFQLATHGASFSKSTSRPRQRSSQLYQSGGGFGGAPSPNESSSKTSSTTQNNKNPKGEFAFQEMLVFFKSMQDQGVTSKTMDPAKRVELEGYIRTVLRERQAASLPLSQIGAALLPSSSWKLMFSTSSAVLESLPQDATVFINILDDQTLDYKLQFSKKTLGLDSLTAKCSYSFDSGPVQPGLLTFVYDKITTNILGFQNVGVGFFGMLQGRANYVESAYFDGTFWIERGMSPTAGDGSDFINVYMRMDD